MTDIILNSTVELSRDVAAKDVSNTTRHVLQTIGQAARFMQTNFSDQGKLEVAWRNAALRLDVAAKTGDATHIAGATIALEVLLKENGLLIE